MQKFINRRQRHLRSGVFFVLIISLLLPHPSIVVGQEATPPESEESTTPNDTLSVPEDTNENDTEGELSGSSKASENQDKRPF
jgi:hypothetical protein